MPVLDSGQSCPDANNTSEDDRENSGAKPDGSTGGLTHYQKYGKAHYEKNKAYYVKRSAESKKKAKAAWTKFKATLSCTTCGENHPATLDFHHVVRKPDNRKVHRLIGNGSFKGAMKEIVERCIVLCANCHRKHHYEEHKKKAPHKAGRKIQQEEK